MRMVSPEYLKEFKLKGPLRLLGVSVSSLSPATGSERGTLKLPTIRQS